MMRLPSAAGIAVGVAAGLLAAVLPPLSVAAAQAPAVAAPSSPGQLTLSEALRRVAKSSPRRAASVATADAARRAAALAGRLPNPSLELRAENWGGGDAGGSLTDDYFAVLTMPIELGGKRRARRDLAEADVALADSALRDGDSGLLLETASRFLAAVRAGGFVDVLVELRAGAAEVVRMVRRRAESGVAPEGDVAKFEAELARIDGELVRARLAQGRALAGLQVLLDEPLAGRGLLAPAVPAAPAGDPAVLAREAVERRADVALARARVARAERNLAVETSRAVPDIALSGGWKRTNKEDTGVVALSIPLPVSDRNGAAIAVATGEHQAALAELATVRADAELATRAALEEAAALGERARRAGQEMVAPAAVALRAARASLEEGGGDALRLVDAERVYTEARREVLELASDATLAVLTARISLGEDPATVLEPKEKSR